MVGRYISYWNSPFLGEHVRWFMFRGVQQHNSPTAETALSMRPCTRLTNFVARLVCLFTTWDDGCHGPDDGACRVDRVEGMKNLGIKKSVSGDLKVRKQGDVRRAMCFCLAGCKSKIVKLYQIVVSRKGKLQYTKKIYQHGNQIAWTKHVRFQFSFPNAKTHTSPASASRHHHSDTHQQHPPQHLSSTPEQAPPPPQRHPPATPSVKHLAQHPTATPN